MATTVTPQPLIVKSGTDVRDDILRTIKNGLIEQGVVNPQVSVTSDFGLIASALGNEVAIPGNNTVLLADQSMPDTATGSDLDRILGFYGLTRRAASQSGGLVIANSASSAFVPLGSQLTDPSGVKFQVSVGGVYSNGSFIPVQSVDAGSQTNEDAGVSLTWVSPPAFFSPTVIVSDNTPITGGIDAENDETARSRLLSYLQNPPGGANPSQIIDWAQASDPSVQSAAVCAASRGPGTVDVAVFGYASSINSSRVIDPVVLKNKIAPYIQGQFPQFADGYVANVQNYGMDVSVGLSLPLPTTAVPAGPGGGWLDPAPLQTTTTKLAIRVVDGYALSGMDPTVPQNTATAFWVDFPVAPLGGVQYSISYLSPVTLTTYSAVTSGTYINGPTYSSLSAYTTIYYITCNSPFYSNSNTNAIIQPGNYIFPTAVNTATYVAAFLNFMQNMGPGERTTVAGLLPRALRQPLDVVSFPYRLNSRICKPIIDSGPEVYDAQLLFRGSYLDTATTPGANFTDYASPSRAPYSSDITAYSTYSPPTTYPFFGTMQAPSLIFIPNNIGFYPINL
jgi:hypothetical protein